MTNKKRFKNLICKKVAEITHIAKFQQPFTAYGILAERNYFRLPCPIRCVKTCSVCKEKGFSLRISNFGEHAISKKVVKVTPSTNWFRNKEIPSGYFLLSIISVDDFPPKLRCGILFVSCSIHQFLHCLIRLARHLNHILQSSCIRNNFGRLPDAVHIYFCLGTKKED